jgi:isoquinoline 1-oxidoreductase alpha subunit
MGESMTTLNINGHDHSVDVANDTPLLWVIREHLRMTGTKFGCGAGLCGACTVHLNGEAVRSCQVAVSQAAAKKIVTIEGLDPKGEHPLQRAWIAEQVPQLATANPGRLCKPRHCSPRTPIRPRPKSSRTWTATSAVA